MKGSMKKKLGVANSPVVVEGHQHIGKEEASIGDLNVQLVGKMAR